MLEPRIPVSASSSAVSADAKGKFETTLKLKEGKNAIEVKGHSVNTLESTSTHQIELDTTVRKTTIDKNLWGPQKK